MWVLCKSVVGTVGAGGAMLFGEKSRRFAWSLWHPLLSPISERLMGASGVQIVGTGTEMEVYGPPLPSDMAKSISAQPSSIVVRMEESTEPTPAPIYVYCNTGGKNYHSQDCKYVYEHTPRVTLLEAVKASYTKCPYCNAPDASAIFD